ncbi:hypothetical protein bsdE14_25410 [Clostridium omnivorum]|uniref:Uncharacterized protein n=1 Tax=Clostridium omnivorum TaxID=1604902 RepID=A0ABQ5N7M0_9CLOT|nr:hypothetical protein bsdE14_25410 [Clostridium sp. E14]
MDIIEGKKIESTFYAVICWINDNDDWGLEKDWYKANSALEHTIDIEKVRNAYKSERENIAEENIFT